jgi:peptidoglycan/LPS O-acetylase OafA/YrhL
MQKMSLAAFTKLRIQRLLLPTFIWTFILVAPQIYFERRLQGMDQSYVEFYQTFLTFNWWPNGNFHWLHLWFIPYLFCYNLLSIPIVKGLESNAAIVLFLERLLQKPIGLLGFILVAILPYTFLFSIFPASYDLVNDWARHSFFFSFILIGLLFFRFPAVLEMLEAKRSFFLRLAFLSILLINGIRWSAYAPFTRWEDWSNNTFAYGYLLLLNVNTWMWVLASLGYGKKYLNRGSRLLTYANTAVYPFYILHQTVIVIIAYFIVQTSDTIGFKFIFLLVICFVVIILLYHLFIRPYNWLRFLFGMKKK